MIYRYLMCVFVMWSSASFAGDPCPITYNFHNLGVIEKGGVSPLERLKSRASWIGITYRDVREGEAERGVLISKLPPDSPARDAGVQVNDVLIGINQSEVSHRDSVDTILDARDPAKPLVFTLMRGSVKHTITVQPKLYDPLLRRLISANDAEDDCANTRLDTSLSEARLTQLRAYVLSPKPSFYCADAHQRLQQYANKQGGISKGDIVFVRGTWRALISVVGFDTTCVRSAEYDGSLLTTARVRELFQRITADYTNDRFENP